MEPTDMLPSGSQPPTAAHAGPASHGSPRTFWLLCLLILCSALLPSLLETVRGPMEYLPALSDLPLIWTRSRLVRLTGTVAGTTETVVESAIGGYVTGRTRETLTLVAHRSGVVILVAGHVPQRAGQAVSLVGRLQPTFPSLRVQFAGDARYGRAPYKMRRTLQVGGGAHWWLAALLLVASLWVGWRHRTACSGSPPLDVTEETDTRVWHRRGGIAVCLLFACAPAPLFAYLADGWLRPVVALLAVGLAAHLLRQMAAPYLLLNPGGLCLNSLFVRRYLPWSAIRQLSVLHANDQAAGVRIVAADRRYTVHFGGILHNVTHPKGVLGDLAALAPGEVLHDWPAAAGGAAGNQPARGTPAADGWSPRQWVSLALCAAGIVGWWIAAAVCIANNQVIAWSFVAAFIVAPLCVAGVVIEA